MSSQHDRSSVYYILAFCFANKNTADQVAKNVITDMQGYNANVVTLTVGDEASGEIAAAMSADIDAPVESDPDGSGTP